MNWFTHYEICGMKTILTVPFVALVLGCQSYRPIPLETSEVLSVWREIGRAGATTLPSGRLDGPSNGTTRSGVGLDDAEEVALLFNPELRKARLEARVARVSAGEAGRWEDPSVSFDVERIVSGAKDPWVVGGMVNLTIPLSGRLKVEKQLALSEAEVAELRVLLLERETVAELRSVWVAWTASTRRVEALERAVSGLETFDLSAGRLRDAGELDPTDARLFSIDLARRQAQLLGARREREQFEYRIRRVMGLSPEAELRLQAESDPLPDPTPESLDIHPRIVLARAEYQAAEKALELEVRKQYPDLQLGGGFGSDQGDSRLLGGVALPIPLLNGNRRAIAEARAKREVARGEFEAQLIRLETSRAEVSRDVEATERVISSVRENLIPLVDRQLSDAKRLLELGEFNPLVVREAIDAATEAELELIAARLSKSQAVIEQMKLNENPFARPIPKATGEARK